MSLRITAAALLTAHGEGVEALGTAPPWATFAGGHRAARWPGVASDACPEVPVKVAQRDRACGHALLVARRLLGALLEGVGEPSRVGVILGTALGCGSVNDAFHRGLVTATPSPVLFGYTVPSAPVGEVAAAFGLQGHQGVVMAGRCSGIAAVAEARRALLLGRADALLVLASDALSPDRAALLGAQGEPAPIEATAALLIERDEHARAHGRAALATLDGAGLRHEGASPWPVGRPSYLGASGVVELIAALGALPESLEIDVTDRQQRAWLRVRASR